MLPLYLPQLLMEHRDLNRQPGLFWQPRLTNGDNIVEAPRAIIGQRGSLRPLAGISLFQKVIFRTMRTTRKQFPVNWLTSGRLAFTIQRAKARRRQQIKKMAAQVEGRCGVDKLAFFNKEPTIETA